MGIVLPKITYGAMVSANKAANYKKHLDRVQRLGLLAMAHIHCSTPTARLEVILGVMLLDLHAPLGWCAGSGVRIRADGMALGIVTSGATFSGAFSSWNRWTERTANSNKRAIQDLFHNRRRERWKHPTICHQTKY